MTFRGASCTVVLDREIEQLVIDTPIHEMSWRLDLSDWARRLWTYEECVVSEDRVLFKCKDGLLAIPDLARESIANSTPKSTGPYEYKALDMISHPRFVDRMVMNQEAPSDPPFPGVFIVLMARSVSTLTTSRSGDETLCLASVLDQNTKELAELPAESRMERFLREIQFFAPHILFGGGPRSKESGLGWAPATFLMPHMFPIPLKMQSFDFGHYCSPAGCAETKGFVVALCGYDLTKCARRLALSSAMIPPGSNRPTHRLVYCDILDGSSAEWFDLIKGSGENSASNESQEWMPEELPLSVKLILLREDLQGEAILVESLDRKAGLDCVKFIARMIVRKEDGAPDLGDATTQSIDKGRMVEATPIPKDHRWLIV